LSRRSSRLADRVRSLHDLPDIDLPDIDLPEISPTLLPTRTRGGSDRIMGRRHA